MSDEPRKLSPEQEAAVERIRKIVSKCNHTGGVTQASEEEMNSAMEMARRMMSKFDIDEGLFEKLVQGGDSARNDAFTSMTEAEAYFRKTFKGLEFFLRLARAVAAVTDTGHRNVMEYKQEGKRGTGPGYQEVIKFYGLPRDAAVATALFQELVATVHAMAYLRCGKGGWTLSHSSYAFGLCDRLHSRARSQKEDASASSGNEEAAKAGAIVLSKDALLRRYEYDVLGHPRPMTAEERAKNDAEYQALQKKHEDLMLSDPTYRRRYESAQAKAAKRKGPRARRLDSHAYDMGHSDGGDVSLGTNTISRKAGQME